MNRFLIVWLIFILFNFILNLKKKNGLGDIWVIIGINYIL